MLPLTRLFEELSSFSLSRSLQKGAVRAFKRGTWKQDRVAQHLAKVAKDVSPKYQSMKYKG